MLVPRAAQGNVVLVGVGMTNQQMPLAISVPWSFLVAPALLGINLEQCCAFSLILLRRTNW